MNIKMKLILMVVLFATPAFAKLKISFNGRNFENQKLNKYFDGEKSLLKSPPVPKNVVDDKIIEFLEGIRENITDPLIIESVNIPLEQKPLIQANLDLSELTITGMKDFVIELIRFKIIGLSLEYELLVPKFLITSNYDLQGKALVVVPLNSNGNVKIQANGLHIKGNATLGTTLDGYLLLRSFLIDFDVDSTEVNISSIIGIDQLDKVINWIIDYMSDDFFQGQRDRLNEWASRVLFDIIGEAISNISLADLIG